MLVDVDAAAISLVFDGANSGTLGSSGEHARVYDELQFILGEGPCLDSVSRRAPVVVVDLADPDDARWPIYGPAMLDLQVHGVYAMPVLVAGEYVGALDLFCAQPGRLDEDHFTGAVAAAELAASRYSIFWTPTCRPPSATLAATPGQNCTSCPAPR